MFPLLMLTTALAADASLRIDVDVPVRVHVDGSRWHAQLETPNRTQNPLAPGRHEVKVMSDRGGVLYTGLVEVPEGYEVRCTWIGGQFDCPTALEIHRPRHALTGLPGDAPTVLAAADYGVIGATVAHHDAVELIVRTPDGTWTDVLVDGLVVMELRNERERHTSIAPGVHTLEFRDVMSDRGWAKGQVDTGRLGRITIGVSAEKTVEFYDSRGWISGGGLGVPSIGVPQGVHTEGVSTSSFHWQESSPRVVTLDPWSEEVPAAIVPDSVVLRIRSTDGEWADILVDGELVLEIRNDAEEQVIITPGHHTVEVREFLEEEPYTRGSLITGTAAVVTLGITEDEPTVCYDHNGWISQ